MNESEKCISTKYHNLLQSVYSFKYFLKVLVEISETEKQEKLEFIAAVTRKFELKPCISNDQSLNIEIDTLYSAIVSDTSSNQKEVSEEPEAEPTKGKKGKKNKVSQKSDDESDEESESSKQKFAGFSSIFALPLKAFVLNLFSYLNYSKSFCKRFYKNSKPYLLLVPIIHSLKKFCSEKLEFDHLNTQGPFEFYQINYRWCRLFCEIMEVEFTDFINIILGQIDENSSKITEGTLLRKRNLLLSFPEYITGKVEGKPIQERETVIKNIIFNSLLGPNKDLVGVLNFLKLREDIINEVFEKLLKLGDHKSCEFFMIKLKIFQGHYFEVVKKIGILKAYSFYFSRFLENKQDFACFYTIFYCYPDIVSKLLEDLLSSKKLNEIQYILDKNESEIPEELVNLYKKQVNNDCSIVQNFEFYGPIDLKAFTLPREYFDKHTLIVESNSSIEALKNFLLFSSYSISESSEKYVIGFDTESEVKVSSLQDIDHSCSLIQIAISSLGRLPKKEILTVLLDPVQIQKTVSDEHKNLLIATITWLFEESTKIVGFSLKNDFKHMRPYIDSSFTKDLSSIILDFESSNSFKGSSLKDKCHSGLGITLCKSCQLSNWSKRPLLPQQIHYSTLDAYVLLLLYREQLVLDSTN